MNDTHEAILVDVSRTGVRLRGENLPDEGQELILTIESVRTFGWIAWKRSGECGIAFDGPLPPGEVEAIRHKAGKSRGLAPEQQAAFDDWTQGMAR